MTTYQSNDNDEWIVSTIIKWIVFIPGFFISLAIFQMLLGQIVLTIVNDYFLENASLQHRFIVSQIYLNGVCVAASIYFSCTIAPRWRSWIAIIYLFVIIFLIPSRLTYAQQDPMYYGDYAWKSPFLTTIFVLSAVIPLGLILLEEKREKRRRLEEV